MQPEEVRALGDYLLGRLGELIGNAHKPKEV
jgi:hypothetical protein